MNEKNQVQQASELEWINHPLVGQYRYRVEQNSWIAKAPVHGIDYSVSLNAKGPEPIQAQMDTFAELIARLPGIISSSNLPDAPTDEWRKKHPEYRLLNAKVQYLSIRKDGNFLIFLGAFPEDDWSPSFETSPDFIVIEAEWIT
ncbi:hypothetical protein [Undibacterium umbellatum]|uniref:DUF1795 domain-containing protein n=1 Tax=Undibacterium umbellatum TaxID=2762300 RepID=A0ABR6Z8F1_9BURK|nr:hypothetical protein [Undibacterium umbellatum]MBC3908037.1 hypothetical protein [Undibacterium umbellatum]